MGSHKADGSRGHMEDSVCRAGGLLLLLLLAMAAPGCGLLGGGGRQAAGGDGSLEAALGGLVPLPYGAGAVENGIDAADAAAAAAAAGAVPTGAGTALDKSGEPLLRQGLAFKVAVLVGDKQEVPETTVQVSEKGDVTLPLVGKVPCEGLTLLQFKARLVERYGDFFREPEVSATFVYDERSESPWGRVYVQGRVRNEGWVNIPPTRNMTVSRAIQLAGGFDTSAKKGSILVTRREADGSVKQVKVDLMAVGRYGETENDVPLESGDIVYVPESRI